jgi:hypothetical protein
MADDKPNLFDRVKGMAEELGLEAEEKEQYISQHMKKAGWVPNTSWSPPDGKSGDGKKPSGWFNE